MAQMSDELASSILRGSGVTSGEVMQLCHRWLVSSETFRILDSLARYADTCDLILRQQGFAGKADALGNRVSAAVEMLESVGFTHCEETRNISCRVCNGSEGQWGHGCDPDGCDMATPKPID